jgi:hypothetical protein
MAEEIVLNVRVDKGAAEKNITELTSSIVGLENENKRLRESFKKGEISAEELSEALAKNNQVLTEQKKQRKDNINVLNTENNSRKALEQSIKKNNEELRNLDTTTEKGKKRAKELTEELKSQREQLNQAKKAAGDYTSNIGNYANEIISAVTELKKQAEQQKNNILALEKAKQATSESSEEYEKVTLALQEQNEALENTSTELKKYGEDIEDAIVITDGAEQSMLSFDDTLQELPGGFQQATQGAKNLGKQFLRLLANPIIALIAAIVLGLTAMFKAFKKTQEGQDTFNKLFVQASAIIDTVLGRIGRLAQAAVKLIKGDVKGAAELATGAFKGMREEIENTVKEAGNLADARHELRKLTVDLTTSIAELQKFAEEQGAIADDATKSFQERQIAADRAFSAEVSARSKEIELAKANLSIIQRENALKQQQGFLTDELRQAEADAKVLVIEAEKAKTLAVLNNTKRINELRQDNFEQELDFLLDVADAQKTVNERRLTDDNLALGERKKIFKETEKLLNDSFDQQLALFERENEINLNRSKLLELNNQEIFEYARGLGLSEIETNRLLEVIKERRFALQDLADAQRDLTDEEVERQEAATQKLREIRKEAILKELEDITERRDKLIEFETEDFKRKLENDLLLAEERDLIEEEHKLRLKEIDDEYANYVIENQDRIVEETLNSFDEILKAAGEFNSESINNAAQAAGRLIQISNDLKAGRISDEEAAAKQSVELITGYTNVVASIGKERLENYKANRDAEIEKLIQSGKSEEEAKRIVARKTAALEIQQFNLEKSTALVNAAVNTAVAVTKTLANPILAAVVGALGAVQIGVIAAKQPPPMPTFEKGGALPFGGKLIKGNPHSMGGVDLMTSSGQYLGNAQGDEGVFITNKLATAKLIEGINIDNGGRGFGIKGNRYFQDGGQVEVTNSITSQSLAAAFRDAVTGINIVTKIEDIRTGEREYNRVVNNGVIG